MRSFTSLCEQVAYKQEMDYHSAKTPIKIHSIYIIGSIARKDCPGCQNEYSHLYKEVKELLGGGGSPPVKGDFLEPVTQEKNKTATTERNDKEEEEETFILNKSH